MSTIFEFIFSIFRAKYPDPIKLTMEELNDKALELYGIERLFECYEGEFIYNDFDLFHILGEAKLITIDGFVIEAHEQTVSSGNIESLVTMHLLNSDWGAIKWGCVEGNMQPCSLMERRMKYDGYWDSELENLPENIYD